MLKEGDDTAYGLALFPVPANDPNDPLQVIKTTFATIGQLEPTELTILVKKWPRYKKTMILVREASSANSDSILTVLLGHLFCV